MVDIFLIVVALVALCIMLVMGVYLLVYYQHPDDHNDAYFPKVVVILGFVLAGSTVLLLPLDVANREGYAGTYVNIYKKDPPTARVVGGSNHKKCDSNAMVGFPSLVLLAPTMCSRCYTILGCASC